jgi:pimeloyl-ACP methyl ester carboxylesterase
MNKQFIKNRKNQKVAVVTEQAQNQSGLVFLMHGLGDSKDSKHIRTFAKCFLNNNYTVISFDTTNTFGESDGSFADADLTNYYEDFEDVINWAKQQAFFQTPFVLCGHSLGAISSAFYAENHPSEVKALAPFSTVINVDLTKKNYTKEELADWERTGYLIEDWGAQGQVKIKWSYLEAKAKYDLLKEVDKLVMPVLMIVGELDNTTPAKHQQILFNKLPGQKEFHVLKNTPHTFRTEQQLQDVYEILDKWLKTIK